MPGRGAVAPVAEPYQAAVDLAARAAQLASTTLVQLGPAEVVQGPGDLPDNPFTTVGGESGLLAYVANSNSVGFRGASLENLVPMGKPVLAAGETFDSCGAWLNSAVRDGPVIRAWYHAETACNYPATTKSVAYALSTDGGATFAKPHYPDNQVITAPKDAGPTAEGELGEGDQHVLRVGDHYYLYFVASRDYQVRLAVAPRASGGGPGTWLKYLNGAFTEPGLSGDSSPIDPSGQLARSWISLSVPLNTYIGFSHVAHANTGSGGGSGGFGLTFSTDGVTGWSALPYLVLPSPGTWAGRTEASGELVEYPSMVSLEGSTETVGNSFWLYYMLVPSGQPLQHSRYLIRRRIALSEANGSAPTDLVPRVTLATYELGKDSWTSTTITSTSYAFLAALGTLYTQPVPNSIPLYDCYLPIQGDHMLSRLADCEGPQAINMRRLGWIAQDALDGGVQIFRCYEPARARHFISTDPACTGATVEGSFGWLAPAPDFSHA
jgi:hypothetical protein